VEKFRQQYFRIGSEIMTSAQGVSISHLGRRKIEGRVLIPFIKACRERFGEEATQELVVSTIRSLAASDGAKWAETYGNGIASIERIAEEVWAGGGSMDIDLAARTEERLEFNVTRCGYAEFYQELGLADLGYLVHCNRDYAMLTSFNPDIELVRTGTVMEGAPCCDFKFRKKP
jgi:hypothetical protein